MLVDMTWHAIWNDITDIYDMTPNPEQLKVWHYIGNNFGHGSWYEPLSDEVFVNHIRKLLPNKYFELYCCCWSPFSSLAMTLAMTIDNGQDIRQDIGHNISHDIGHNISHDIGQPTNQPTTDIWQLVTPLQKSWSWIVLVSSISDKTDNVLDLTTFTMCGWGPAYRGREGLLLFTEQQNKLERKRG